MRGFWPKEKHRPRKRSKENGRKNNVTPFSFLIEPLVKPLFRHQSIAIAAIPFCLLLQRAATHIEPARNPSKPVGS